MGFPHEFGVVREAFLMVRFFLLGFSDGLAIPWGLSNDCSYGFSNCLAFLRGFPTGFLLWISR